VAKGKAIAVTGSGGQQGSETSRLQHFPENRLTDGGEVVSLTRRPAALYPQGHSAAGRIRLTENFTDFVGNRICDFPDCSLVP
jgi:hypothetical protein